MKYKQFIALFILSFCLLINVGSAYVLPNGFELKDENITWNAATEIMIPFNNNVQKELIIHTYSKNESVGDLLNVNINQMGTLLTDIELYFDDEKKNFDEFFVLEIEKEKFKITQKKGINRGGYKEIKLKYYIISPSVYFSFDEESKILSYATDFNLGGEMLYREFIFRMPAVNAHNILLSFKSSGIVALNTEKSLNSFPASVSRIYSTDEYIDVNFLFWNGILAEKVVLNELEFSLNPGKYIFQNKFTIQYETFRWEWVMAIILSSVVAIITFIGGALWVKRKGE